MDRVDDIIDELRNLPGYTPAIGGVTYDNKTYFVGRDDDPDEWFLYYWTGLRVKIVAASASASDSPAIVAVKFHEQISRS